MGPHHHSPVDRHIVDIGAVDGSIRPCSRKRASGAGVVSGSATSWSVNWRAEKCPRSGLWPMADELTEPPCWHRVAVRPSCQRCVAYRRGPMGPLSAGIGSAGTSWTEGSKEPSAANGDRPAINGDLSEPSPVVCLASQVMYSCEFFS